MFINYKSRELINSVVERREEKVELNNIKQLRQYRQNDGHAEIPKDIMETKYFMEIKGNILIFCFCGHAEFLVEKRFGTKNRVNDMQTFRSQIFIERKN